MAYSRDTGVRKLMAQLPGALAKNVLRGAARAAVNVVADEAKARCASEATREAIATKASATGDKIIGKVFVKPGWGRSVGIWLEYGTDPHFISVDDSQRDGRSVNRINTLTREGSLVIGGHFVGKTVHHPGARAHPFMRVSLDTKESEAVAAAQAHIAKRVAAGVFAPDPEPAE